MRRNRESQFQPVMRRNGVTANVIRSPRDLERIADNKRERQQASSENERLPDQPNLFERVQATSRSYA
jgi:hypothetical protein